MKRLLIAFTITASVVLSGGAASAITVATDPVGFANLSLPANSDSYISVPFTRPAVFAGAIQSVTTNTITLTGSPGFTPSSFVYTAGSQPNHYYALIGNGGSSNPKEGHTFLITGNTANTVTVDTSLEPLTGITQNTQVTIIPYWTLATVFPSSDAGSSFTATTSTASPTTQIIIPNDAANGINLPPLATYYFSNNADGSSSNVGWRATGNNTADRGDDILLPDSYFIVRNQNGAPTRTVTTLGAVLTKKFATPLRTIAGSQQDNPASILRPLDVPLSMTGLNPTDGSFVAGNGTTTGDQLLLFSNSQIGLNKTPAVYYRDSTTNTWHLQGDTTLLDHGNDIIPMGTGFIVRKAATASPSNVFWTNSFPVQAISAVSRKVHGSIGTFDLNLPLTGTPAIESRGPTNGGYQVVFTFPTPVTVNNANISYGTASVNNVAGSGSTTVTVDIGPAPSTHYVTVTLAGVSDGTNTNDVSVTMGVLIGDANGDGFVNAADATITRNRSGQDTNATNFRSDYNTDGTINAADATTVRSRSGNELSQ